LNTVLFGRLAGTRCRWHHGEVNNESDQEATQLILEALFDIKVRVSDIHNVLFLDDGDEEEETEEDA